GCGGSQQSETTQTGTSVATGTPETPSAPASSEPAATEPAKEVATAGGVDPELAKKGEAVYNQLGCNTCHMNPKSAVKSPDLRGLYGHEVKLTNGQTVKADEAYLIESIKNPTAKVVEGYQPVMPPYAALSDEQINQLVAYIKSLADQKPEGTS
ncbi:MAG: c-type cytochrome, partial [Fimbriimonadales bacterium]